MKEMIFKNDVTVDQFVEVLNSWADGSLRRRIGYALKGENNKEAFCLGWYHIKVGKITDNGNGSQFYSINYINDFSGARTRVNEVNMDEKPDYIIDAIIRRIAVKMYDDRCFVHSSSFDDTDDASYLDLNDERWEWLNRMLSGLFSKEYYEFKVVPMDKKNERYAENRKIYDQWREETNTYCWTEAVDLLGEIEPEDLKTMLYNHRAALPMEERLNKGDMDTYDIHDNFEQAFVGGNSEILWARDSEGAERMEDEFEKLDEENMEVQDSPILKDETINAIMTGNYEENVVLPGKRVNDIGEEFEVSVTPNREIGGIDLHAVVAGKTIKTAHVRFFDEKCVADALLELCKHNELLEEIREYAEVYVRNLQNSNWNYRDEIEDNLRNGVTPGFNPQGLKDLFRENLDLYMWKEWEEKWNMEKEEMIEMIGGEEALDEIIISKGKKEWDEAYDDAHDEVMADELKEFMMGMADEVDPDEDDVDEEFNEICEEASERSGLPIDDIINQIWGYDEYCKYIGLEEDQSPEEDDKEDEEKIDDMACDLYMKSESGRWASYTDDKSDEDEVVVYEVKGKKLVARDDFGLKISTPMSEVSVNEIKRAIYVLKDKLYEIWVEFDDRCKASIDDKMTEDEEQRIMEGIMEELKDKFNDKDDECRWTAERTGTTMGDFLGGLPIYTIKKK